MTRMRERFRLIPHLKAQRESDAGCRWDRQTISGDALPRLDFALSEIVLYAKYLELS